MTETSQEWAEWLEVLSNKAIIIDRVDTSQQRAEPLEVLTKTKQERIKDKTVEE